MAAVRDRGPIGRALLATSFSVSRSASSRRALTRCGYWFALSFNFSFSFSRFGFQEGVRVGPCMTPQQGLASISSISEVTAPVERRRRLQRRQFGLSEIAHSGVLSVTENNCGSRSSGVDPK